MERCIGAARYMAPEVVTEDDYGLPADMFSYGILLHELTTGEVPCNRDASQSEDDDVRIILNILEGGRPSLDGLAGHGIMAELRRLLGECWDADTTRRPAAADLVTRIRGIVESTAAALDLPD